MSSKTFVSLGIIVGSLVGGYIPSLFGAGGFSAWSILSSGIGSIIGLLFALKITQD